MASSRPVPGFFGTLWRMSLVGVLLFAASGAAAYGVVWHLIKTPEREAPDLIALDLSTALEEAGQEGFALRIGTWEESDLLDSGEVLAQRPMPGDWVKEGTTIVLTVAK